MFGSRLGFSGSNGAICGSIKSKMAADGHLGYKNGHNFAIGLPIDVMFGSSVGILGSPDLMVQLSMTLSDPEPQFQGHSWYSLKANISETAHPIHYIWF